MSEDYVVRRRVARGRVRRRSLETWNSPLTREKSLPEKELRLDVTRPTVEREVSHRYILGRRQVLLAVVACLGPDDDDDDDEATGTRSAPFLSCFYCNKKKQ